MTKYAEIGTISHGTLRDEDLLDAFAGALEYQVQRNAEAWCSDDGRKERERHMTLINDARECDPESDDAVEIVGELQDALDSFSAPYCRFGAHEGDGANFGFWPCIDALESDVRDGEVVQVSDLSELDEHDIDGADVMVVNDHGNVTYGSYNRETREFTELWSCV